MTGGALRMRPAPNQPDTRNDAMTANVKIVAVLTARADTVDRLRALLDGMLEPSRAEPGNLRYDLW
jgi:nucleoside diphosphate kinase